MLEELKDVLREIVADDEIFDLMGKAVKRAHESLINNGFNEEQATKIIAGQGIGIRKS